MKHWADVGLLYPIFTDTPYDKPHISFSQYQIFKRCPLQWKLKYIDKLAPFESSIDTIFGKAMHETIQLFFKTALGKTKKAATSLPLFDILMNYLLYFYNEERVNRGCDFLTKADIKKYFVYGANGLDYLCKHVSDFITLKEYELVGIELPINRMMNDQGLVFVGRIDLLLKKKSDSRYWMIDIKTSSMGWPSKYKTDMTKTGQLLLYKQFYCEANNIDPDMVCTEFWVFRKRLPQSDYPVPYIQRIRVASGGINTKRIITEVQEFVSKCYNGVDFINEGHYASTKPDSCIFCPHKYDKEVCERWKTNK